MSVNAFDRNKIGTADELKVIATKGVNRTFIGTRAAVDKAIAEGRIGNETIVYITDDDTKEYNEPGMPVGSISAFAGQAAPSGWLLCDGSTFDETIYPELKTLLGTNTTPDLRGRFLMGSTPTEAVRTKIDEQLPNIKGSHKATNFGDPKSKGTFSNSKDLDNAPSRDNGGLYMYEFDINASKTYDPNTSQTIDNPAYKDPINGVPVKVRPDTFVVTYIIKAL